MLIREAHPHDHLVVSDIAFNAKASHGYSESFMESCRAELTYSSIQIESNQFQFFVAELEDSPIGFVAVEVLEGDQCAIEALFVLPAYSGNGFGKALLGRALSWAIKHNMIGVHIQSDPGAIGFYESFGAVKIGESPSGSIPGRKLPQLFIDLSDYDAAYREHYTDS